MQRSPTDAESPYFHDGSSADGEVTSPSRRPSVRFSDRGQTKSIMKRGSGSRRAGSISESSSHGVLFDASGRPTALCGRLFEALAKHLAAEFTPKGGLVMTPAKMAMFLERYPISADPYRHAAASLRVEGPQGYPDIEKLYEDLSCEYHLVRDPSMPKSKPRLPALTPAGFSRYMTISLLAYPEQEFRRLQKATSEMPVLSGGSATAEETMQFPSELIRSLFPAKHDADTRELFDSAMCAFLKITRQPTTSAKDLSPPPRRPSLAAFDPRRYVPGNVQNGDAATSSGTSSTQRHSISYNGDIPEDKQKSVPPSGTPAAIEPVPYRPSQSRSAPATPFPASMPTRDYTAARQDTHTGSSNGGNKAHLAVPPTPLGLMSFPALESGSATSSPAVSRHQSPDIPRHSMAAVPPPAASAPSPLKSSMSTRNQSPQRSEARDAASAAAEVQRHRDSLVTSPSHERGPTWEEVLVSRQAPSSSRSQPQRSRSESKSSSSAAPVSSSATSGSSKLEASAARHSSKKKDSSKESSKEKKRDR